MKKKILIISILLGLSQLTTFGLVNAQTHFTPCLPDTSNPFTPMNVFVIGASINGVDLSAGDEVGLYQMSDPNRCVAAKTVESTLSPSQPLQIIATMDDGDGCGFMEGDTILFKIWDDSKGDSIIVGVEEVVFYNTQSGESLGDSVVVFTPLETAAARLFATIPQFSLSVSVSPVGGGTTDPGLGTHMYDTGTVVALSATSAAGYIFDGWTGAVADPNSAITSIRLDADKSVTANFRQDVVPVELVSFDAEYLMQSRGVLLTWRTASETNNYGFAIERSTTDHVEDWSQTGFVDGHGTSHVPQNYSYFDELETEAHSYYYRLKQMDTDGSYEYSKALKVETSVPMSYALHQNYPNPFNPETKISFQIPHSGYVRVDVLNVLGERVQIVADGYYGAGQHILTIDGKNLPSGMYIYRLRSGRFTSMKKMALLR
ncbi:MAG: T9SS type A sorting domain-containing protein [candidate division KSB1 bacterium]|jgi:uncharacterized repeat protein (TIGR02543 family)|nr:T9SS type A sorting domain-containing protein [candidate division KSB1 bacterium]